MKVQHQQMDLPGNLSSDPGPSRITSLATAYHRRADHRDGDKVYDTDRGDRSG